MTDIEHAKKYAEESISLAISMYNPKAEIIAETACLYGLTFKNERIAELEKENKVLAQNLEDTEILNKTYEKKNKELKTDYEVLSCSVGDFGELQDKLEEEQRKNNGLSDNLTKAKEIIREFVEWATWQGNSKCPSFKSIQDKAEQFLK